MKDVETRFFKPLEFKTWIERVIETGANITKEDFHLMPISRGRGVVFNMYQRYNNILKAQTFSKK